MPVFAHVREARRLFELRYSEQLTLTADDLAPWLLSDDRPSPGPPQAHKAVIAEQTKEETT